jgi:hypothetical protein
MTGQREDPAPFGKEPEEGPLFREPTSAADLRAAAERIESQAPTFARRMRQEAEQMEAREPWPLLGPPDG